VCACARLCVRVCRYHHGALAVHGGEASPPLAARKHRRVGCPPGCPRSLVQADGCVRVRVCACVCAGTTTERLLYTAAKPRPLWRRASTAAWAAGGDAHRGAVRPAAPATDGAAQLMAAGARAGAGAGAGARARARARAGAGATARAGAAGVSCATWRFYGGPRHRLSFQFVASDSCVSCQAG
jgi:hypothetical protein